jgi:hypothetical protein
MNILSRFAQAYSFVKALSYNGYSVKDYCSTRYLGYCQQRLRAYNQSQVKFVQPYSKPLAHMQLKISFPHSNPNDLDF